MEELPATDPAASLDRTVGGHAPAATAGAVHQFQPLAG